MVQGYGFSAVLSDYQSSRALWVRQGGGSIGFLGGSG